MTGKENVVIVLFMSTCCLCLHVYVPVGQVMMVFRCVWQGCVSGGEVGGVRQECLSGVRRRQVSQVGVNFQKLL